MFNLPAIFNPKRSLERVFDPTFDIFDNLFDDIKTTFGGAMTYVDQDGNGVYMVEVPGFNKDNLKVELSEGIMTIQGSRELKDKNYVGKSNLFKRLQVGDVENVEAEVKDGILKIVLKYSKPEPKESKVVEVK
jgi:HSP20 family molecular chaperone IbpA